MNLPIPKERTLHLAKQVNQDSINELVKAILMINANDKKLKKIYKAHGIKYKAKPIKLYIDSYGGAVYQCFGLIGVMERSKTPIHTIVTGAAMSCGFMILIHGHKRFAYRHATPMYHQVSSAFWGKVEDMKENYKEGKRLQRKLEYMTLTKTRISREKLKSILKSKKDWYLTADQALKYKVIDKII